MRNDQKKKNNLQKIFSTCIATVFCACFCIAEFSYAEPEHMAIQTPKGKAEQQLAKQNLKNVDLQKIQDPEARKAIQEILRYLKLNQNVKIKN